MGHGKKKRPAQSHAEIEESQTALRASIAQANDMFDKSDRLIKRHKRGLRDERKWP